ncbi:VOC family protein [Robiginitomaculum antarcticum]|uniref:VOC family protein n=1 Tax=Robiginitomaculum antarcticum TaxID=437507 RepID=UPI00037ADACB|nr:VOC family protein [Robiginitomaculum antarcticum]
MSLRPFHMAAPIIDIEATRKFYTQILGCTVGREAPTWIDIDFFGHQLSFHVEPESCAPVATNGVDDKAVPVRHFGVILTWEDWHDLAARLSARAMAFVIEPYIRFKDEPGEQATMFFYDPSGNALEFKSFKSDESLFSTTL